MSERVRALALCLGLAPLGACIVSGTLGSVTTGTWTSDTGDSSTATTTTTLDPTTADAAGVEPGPCASCLADFCVDGLVDCKKTNICKCVIDCAKGGTAPAECIERCEATAVAMQVLACAQDHCAAPCGLE